MPGAHSSAAWSCELHGGVDGDHAKVGDLLAVAKIHFETDLGAATEAARNELDQYRANAGDTGEWAREVEHVCYGSILGQTLGTEDPSQLDAYGEPCVDFSLDGQTIDECRAAFEDFMMRDSNVPLDRDGEGYRDFTASLAWRFWRAGATLSPRPGRDNPWQRAVDTEMVNAHLGVAGDVSHAEARQSLKRLMDFNVQTATDPACNGGKALIQSMDDSELRNVRPGRRPAVGA